MTGIFEWKQGIFGAKTRVEIETDFISVAHGKRERTVRYADIRKVWLYDKKYRLELMYFVQIEIEAASGERVHFGAGGYGLGGGLAAEETRRAAAAFLTKYRAVAGNAPLLLGLRQGILTIGTLLAIFLGAFAYTWIKMPPQSQEDFLIQLGAMALVLAISIVVWFFTMRAKEKTLDEALEKLRAS